MFFLFAVKRPSRVPHNGTRSNVYRNVELNGHNQSIQLICEMYVQSTYLFDLKTNEFGHKSFVFSYRTRFFWVGNYCIMKLKAISSSVRCRKFFKQHDLFVV